MDKYIWFVPTTDFLYIILFIIKNAYVYGSKR